MSQILLASGTAQGAGTFITPAPAVPVQHFEEIVGAVFILNVTAVAAGAGDSLAVFVQHAIDDGTIFDDFVAFTVVLGNGGVKKFRASWLLYGGTPTVPLGPVLDGALAAGTVNQGPVGSTWRTKAVVAGGTAAFTWTLNVEGLDE